MVLIILQDEGPDSHNSHTAGERDRYRNRDWDRRVLICHAEMFTLVRDRDRDRDALCAIVAVPHPVGTSVISALFEGFYNGGLREKIF